MNKLLTGLLMIIFSWCGARGQSVFYSSDTSKAFVKPMVKAPAQVKPKPPKPVTHEFSGGLRLNTNGWGLFADYAKVKAENMKQIDMFHNLVFWQLELTEKKHAKEQKVSGETNRFGGSNSYKYGKINNFYGLKLGMGYSKLLAGKPDPGSVSIHWSNVAGFSLGLLKPYYLNTVGDPDAIKYSDATRERFLNSGLIRSDAGFAKGLGEIQYIPGGHIKSAVHFDFSTNNKTVVGVETGVNAEFYSQPIQLMAGQDATSAFYELFIAVQFGKRW